MDSNFDRSCAHLGLPDSSLPRGRHHLSREEVTENQRRRLLIAAGLALAEKGYWQLRVTDIATRAGVSRATFYAQFNDKLDCLLCAHRAAHDEVEAEISAACSPAGGWPGNAVAAVDAVARFVSENPGYASLLTMSVVGAHPDLGEQVLLRREELAERLRRARGKTAGAAGLPPATDQIVVGASASFMAHVIHRNGPGALLDQMPDLAHAILALYGTGEDPARAAPVDG